jgi:hypothetical protein
VPTGARLSKDTISGAPVLASLLDRLLVCDYKRPTRDHGAPVGLEAAYVLPPPLTPPSLRVHECSVGSVDCGLLCARACAMLRGECEVCLGARVWAGGRVAWGRRIGGARANLPPLPISSPCDSGRRLPPPPFSWPPSHPPILMCVYVCLCLRGGSTSALLTTAELACSACPASCCRRGSWTT